eukprot:scaffold5244_cov61-Phaeocystis_antarctica.AAC.2
MSTLHEASHAGDTELVKQLLDDGAPVDGKDEHSMTAPMLADEFNTALMRASLYGHTEVVKLLLDKDAPEKEECCAALMMASKNGDREVVKLLLDTMVKRLLDKGESLDEKDKVGRTLLMEAGRCGHTEIVVLLIDHGASIDLKDETSRTGLMLALASVNEDQLGRMAAFQVRRHLLERQGDKHLRDDDPAVMAAATGLLQLVRLAGMAAARARALRSSDPRSADNHQALFGRLQLAAAACVQNDASGKARGEKDVRKLFRSVDGLNALEHAVEVEAKELLAQPVVQKYIKHAWGDGLVGAANAPSGWVQIVYFAIVKMLMLLLQLLFLLPPVTLVPALEPWLTEKLVVKDKWLDDQNLLACGARRVRVRRRQ